jgi:hypothetical protein
MQVYETIGNTTEAEHWRKEPAERKAAENKPKKWRAATKNLKEKNQELSGICLQSTSRRVNIGRSCAKTR